MQKKRAFTGLQPSGTLHIGNYFGALKPFLDLYEAYDSHLCVVDYHALTSLRNAEELRRNILDITRDYLAVGIDPTKAIIFRQSDVPEHAELTWVLNCVTPVAMLQLGHAYKDKVAKGLEANSGLFTYPVLMTADIVLYDTDVVPVGEDQRQHLEYARDIAGKFNAVFGATFKEPKEHILKELAVVPGTDGKKMSKSYKNTIPLFAEKDELREAVMSIVTDSKGERPEIVYAIHRLFKDDKTLSPLYTAHTKNYKALKEALIDDLDSFMAPLRERRKNISDDEVRKVLMEGGEKARARAAKKMAEVRARIGTDIS